MSLYDEQQIIKFLDKDIKEYLKNKNKGGKNGQKGTRYEEFFCVYQLAYLALKIIEHNVEIYFYSQAKNAFVDDLITCIYSASTEHERYHYQLKNCTTLAWEKQLELDFQGQYDLNCKIGIKNTTLTLVVSLEKLRNNLARKIPNSIISYTEVFHFPWYENINEYIRYNSTFRDYILYLSAFDDKNYVNDKLESVALALYAAWCNKDKDCNSAIEIIKKAKKQKPDFIRCLTLDMNQAKKIEDEIVSLLNKIENFNCYCLKGFLHWNYNLESGVFLHSIETEQFQMFKEKITIQQPESFEDIDTLLMLYTGVN